MMDMYQKNTIEKLAWWIPIRKLRDNFRNYFYDKIDTNISNLVLVTNQKCNLKCKNCANFSPILSEIIPFYDYISIVEDLKKITNKINIYKLQIQGGEFFIHPDCEKILDFVLKNKRVKNVVIATNGTIIPEDRILRKIKLSKKTNIRISNYGKVNDILATRLKTELEKRKIPFYIHNFILGNDMWSYCGDFKMKRLSQENMMKSYNECWFAKVCLTLENGIISICSRATVAHIVQDFEYSNKCGIDIRDDSFNINNLLQFAKARPPVEACYYCYGTSSKQVIPAEQMNSEDLKEIYKLFRSDQIRSDQIRSDQIRSDQNV